MTLPLAALLFGGCFLAGDRLSRLAGHGDSMGAERVVFGAATGLAAAAFLIFLLALLGVLYPFTGWILLFGFYALGTSTLRQEGRNWLQKWRGLPRLAAGELCNRGWASVWYWTLGILFFLGLILAQAPPTRQDTLVYHLAVPRAYLEAHGLTNLPNNKYSFLPLFTEMIYLWAMTFQVEPLPQVMGFGMVVLLAAALAVFFKRWGLGRWAVLPPVLYLTTPTFFETSAQAYVDTPTALWTFLAFYSWDRWRGGERSWWFWRMSLFCGAAVTSKLTAFMVIPLAILGIVLKGRRRPAVWSLQHLLLFATVTGIILAPWWARNIAYSGNPFTPFFMDLLGGEDRINWDSLRSRMEGHLVQHAGRGLGIFDFLALPYTLTFLSRQGGFPFDGNIGLLHFLLIPAWLWLPWRGSGENPRRVRTLAVLVLVLGGVWFLYFQGIRYLAPLFCFLVLGAAWGAVRMLGLNRRSRTGWQQALAWILAGGLGFNLVSIGMDWVRADPLAFVLGRETRDAYLTRRLPPYPVYRAMNAHLGPKDKALFVYMRNYGYLSDKPFVSDSFFEAHTLQKMLQRHPDLPGLIGELKRRGFTHLMFDTAFVFGPAAAFSPPEQQTLHRLLTTRARLLASENGFALYLFMLD